MQNYSAGMFHLVAHAFFKALLFLAAGAVIHSLHGEQDMRKMGGLRYRLKITFWTFLIAALAISGIPPLAGFWSKDDILGSVLAQASSGGGALYYILWILGIVTAGLTAFYMFRLVFGIFAGSYRGLSPAEHVSEEEEEELDHGPRIRSANDIYEAPGVMTVPMIILAILSVIGGVIGSFAIIGLPRWQPIFAFLDPVFTNPQWTSVPAHVAQASLGLQWVSTGISIVVALLGILGVWALYRRGFQYQENQNPAYQLVFHKYYVDELLILVLIRPIQWIGRTASNLLEDDLLDGGSRGVAWILGGSSGLLRRLQTGYMRNYALAILFGVVLIILYYAVRG